METVDNGQQQKSQKLDSEIIHKSLKKSKVEQQQESSGDEVEEEESDDDVSEDEMEDSDDQSVSGSEDMDIEQTSSLQKAEVMYKDDEAITSDDDDNDDNNDDDEDDDDDGKEHTSNYLHKFLQEQQTPQDKKNNTKNDKKIPKGSQTNNVENKEENKGSPETLPTTVFVRGLSVDVDASDLEATLVKFGPIKSCRLVKDKNTGKCVGTAFVDFRGEAACSAAVAAAVAAKKGEGPPLQCMGIEIHVNKAVSSETARDLAKEKSLKQQKQDKRNIYLMKEGQILEGSAAWNDMSEKDQERRKAANKEREQKIKSPKFHVSQTTLFIRNIPTKTTAQEIKQIVIDAVKQRATKEKPKVIKSSILKHKDRKDADGKPKSRGVAVVELGQHDHALAALRQLNNNPNIFTQDKRPIVEFALENREAIQLHEKLKVNRKLSRQKKQMESAEDGDQTDKTTHNQKDQITNPEEKRRKQNKQQKGNQNNNQATNSKSKDEVVSQKSEGTNQKLSKNKKRKLQRGEKKEFDPEVRDKFIQERLERKKQKQQQQQQNGHLDQKQDGQKQQKKQKYSREEKISGGIKKRNSQNRVSFKEKHEQQKQKRRGEQGDKLDALIQQYTAKYFK
eukprot:TRINITY_DN425_c3_g1_i6.p1 TRINITY_DN425_c3_g1~~TRINITY_DN425_c3_g1_i6.p1  ORF type:complete len:619 (-),score=160.43 TRINITY_DN425_c3_g1_i6:386-2242(-)